MGEGTPPPKGETDPSVDINTILEVANGIGEMKPVGTSPQMESEIDSYLPPVLVDEEESHTVISSDGSNMDTEASSETEAGGNGVETSAMTGITDDKNVIGMDSNAETGSGQTDTDSNDNENESFGNEINETTGSETDQQIGVEDVIESGTSDTTESEKNPIDAIETDHITGIIPVESGFPGSDDDNDTDIIEQTITDEQIVDTDEQVVPNGSTDNTSQILGDHEDEIDQLSSEDNNTEDQQQPESGDSLPTKTTMRPISIIPGGHIPGSVIGMMDIKEKDKIEDDMKNESITTTLPIHDNEVDDSEEETDSSIYPTIHFPDDKVTTTKPDEFDDEITTDFDSSEDFTTENSYPTETVSPNEDSVSTEWSTGIYPSKPGTTSSEYPISIWDSVSSQSIVDEITTVEETTEEFVPPTESSIIDLVIPGEGTISVVDLDNDTDDHVQSFSTTVFPEPSTETIQPFDPFEIGSVIGIKPIATSGTEDGDDSDDSSTETIQPLVPIGPVIGIKPIPSAGNDDDDTSSTTLPNLEIVSQSTTTTESDSVSESGVFIPIGAAASGSSESSTEESITESTLEEEDTTIPLGVIEVVSSTHKPISESSSEVSSTTVSTPKVPDSTGDGITLVFPSTPVNQSTSSTTLLPEIISTTESSEDLETTTMAEVDSLQEQLKNANYTDSKFISCSYFYRKIFLKSRC